MNPSDHAGLNRRAFLKRAGLALGATSIGWLTEAGAATALGPRGVVIASDPADSVATAAPARWAIGQLQGALAARGIGVRLEDTMGGSGLRDICVLAAGSGAAAAREVSGKANVALPDAAESLALVPGAGRGRPTLLACGRDVRGLVYALLELADRVTHADQPLDALVIRRPLVERPANAIRSVARCFVSDVEDKPWFNDRAFWRRYLTTLATQRFNRFSFTLGLGYDFATNIRDCYFHFAYPFLVAPPGYAVRAVPLPDAERERNLETLRFISDETAARGLHFQLGLWTHAYQWSNSPHANYIIEGLTPDAHAAYCRDALLALLQACPAISGVTFRIHGESGVPEGNYAFWKTVFDGLVRCGRRVEIDMHAKGIDSPMIDVALATGLPVNVSPKFWAEHMGLPYMQGAIRPLEMPRRDAKDIGFFAKSSGSRSFLRYGYGDLLREDRRYGVLHRIWPGTQRLLLWGDPETARRYGQVSSFCGSAGVEWCEPLSFKGRKGSGLPGGRNAYADASLRPAGGDFEKFLHTYRVWGRCLYDPACDAEAWRRVLRPQFGAGARSAENALAAASRILPLVTTAHCPSAANNNYWPELYTNMPIVDPKRPHPYGDTLSPKRFGAVSPLDPEFFSRIDDYADELLQGEPSPKCSPGEVAQHLLEWAASAEKSLALARTEARAAGGPDFRRLEVDVAIQAGLGRFFAWKLRASVLFALVERTGHRATLQKALRAYRVARAAWAALGESAQDVYLPDITFGYERHLRGHWRDRLPAIDEDIADLEKLLEQPPHAETGQRLMDPRAIERAVRAVLGRRRGTRPTVPPGFHDPPEAFRRGEPLVIRASLAGSRAAAHVTALRLHFRRVNQAEIWQTQDMNARSGRYEAMIPAAYSDSPFPLQYYFEMRRTAGGAELYPDLWHPVLAQPFYVVRQAR